MLQESEFERVGDDVTRSVDVRVIAATNKDLEQRLSSTVTFREDLFYRLSVFPIDVPPLRDRGDDVMCSLRRTFLTRPAQDFGRRSDDPDARHRPDKLRVPTRWPGNVRELKNVIERAVILSPGNVVAARCVTCPKRRSKRQSPEECANQVPERS